MMFVIAIAFGIAGFYLLYNTSLRADRRQDKLSLWLHNRPALSKLLGSSLTVASFAVFIAAYGFGSGTLFGFVTLMTIGSLIVLLSPMINID